MASYTANYNLRKDASTDNYDVTVVNQNLDEIDAQMHQNEVASTTPFTGASSSENGEKGIVPRPMAGDEEKYLRGDGTWQSVQGGGGDISDLDFSQLSVQQIYDLKVALGLTDVELYDYAEFNGGGYITTPFNVSSDYTIEVTFEANYTQTMSIFGTSANTRYPQLTIYNNNWYTGIGTSESMFGSYTSGKHTFINNTNNENTLDGSKVTNYTPSSVANPYLVGFRLQSGNYIGKIYEFKITSISTGDILYDLVPAKKGNDEGMYDKVSDTFTKYTFITVGNEVE